MFNIFHCTNRPNKDLFYHKNDENDVRLGESVSFEIEDYASSKIIILGCPQDEGVIRNKGREGAALAPNTIRTQFYKLTDFGISLKIFDLGNLKIQTTLEKTHDSHSKVVEQILRDGKRLIVLGGGNDISYADGAAMANVFGSQNWLAFNIDAHFDVRAEFPRNSGTPYRQLLEEKFLIPSNFYEMAWQPQVNSKNYYTYLKDLGVGMYDLLELKSSVSVLPSIIETKFLEILEGHQTEDVFWGFDVDSVRAADAPGSSAPSPIGLSGIEFIKIARLAGSFEKTKIIEFSEVNPNFDIDNRTAKLVAVAMHEFCRVCK